MYSTNLKEEVQKISWTEDIVSYYKNDTMSIPKGLIFNFYISIFLWFLTTKNTFEGWLTT